MPRGGKREGAGRKTQWVSGCTFPETTVIRIPRTLRDKLLEIAHRLDAGDEIDLVTKSIKDKNLYLEDKVLELNRELEKLRNEPKQLDLSSINLVTKSKRQMNKIRDEVLNDLPLSKSSTAYKDLKLRYDQFIDKLINAN